jgi:predicted DNA-binding transcriptional regulator AlpA
VLRYEVEMEKQYLAVCEVAQLLGCNEKFVYKHQKRLPGYIKIAGLIRFHRQTLLDGLKPKLERPKPAGNKHGL